MSRLDGFNKHFPDIFRLRIYGTDTKLYTPKVHTMMVVFTIILMLQFGLDFWAWTRTWSYGLESILLATMPGFIFAMAILLFDRTIIVDDTTTRTSERWWTRNSGYLFRLGLTLFLALLTAVAVELSVFKPDIDQRIELAEKAKFDNVLTVARDQERAKFEGLKKAANDELGSQVVDALNRAQGDLDRYVAEQNAKRVQLAEAEKLAAGKAVSEAAGKFSGKRGVGPMTKIAREQEKEAHEALIKFDAETAVHVTELTNLRDQKRDAAQKALQNRLDQLQDDHRQKMEEIDRLAQTDEGKDELVKRSGAGTWRESHGFIARYRILSEITSHGAPRVILWGCRALMIVFGLLILGLKIWAPQEFKLYYSLGAQARAGQPQAKEVVENMGYEPTTYGLEEPVKEQLELLYQLRTVFVGALLDLEQKTLDLAKQGKLGLCQTVEEIEGELHDFWLEKGESRRHNLLQFEEVLRTKFGLIVPTWPAELNGGVDPRSKLTPWVIGKIRLTNEFKWIDPEPRLKVVEEAEVRIVEIYRWLWDFLSREEQNLQNTVRRDSDTSLDELIYRRTSIYRSQIKPQLAELDRLERVMKSTGRTLPEWPRGFNDPRADLERRFIDLDDGYLRRLGWKGSASLAVVSSL